MTRPHPELFAPSHLPPARIDIPTDRSAQIELVVALQRELLCARRTADALHQRIHGRPIEWAQAPRFAKLRFRPLIFGSSPSLGARSSIPFDDATGDALARRWGIPGGFLQLLGLCKLANLYPAPIADLPIEARGDDARYDLLVAHLVGGLFKDRVVILVGAEAQRALGYEPVTDHLGRLDAGKIVGARMVLAMPDPIRSPVWGRPEHRHNARALILQALLAARLPVEAERAVSYARALVPISDDDARMHEMDPAPEECLADLGVAPQSNGLTWRNLCRLGVATPRDLGARAWWPIPDTSTVELYLDRGHLRVTGHRDNPQIAEVIDHEDNVIAAQDFAARGSALRWCEGMAAAKGWEHAFQALDRRLAGHYGKR
jgi:uracil-DNA glycosylase